MGSQLKQLLAKHLHCLSMIRFTPNRLYVGDYTLTCKGLADININAYDVVRAAIDQIRSQYLKDNASTLNDEANEV